MKYKQYEQGNIKESSDAVHASDTFETAQSLELAIAQIEMALKEADHSVAELIGAMTSMACCVQRIEEKLGALRQHEDTAMVVNDIEKECKQAEKDMRKSVTAFQFYDRLSQRFMHIDENLHAVISVIKAPDQQHPALWQSLHEKVRSVYSLEQEQALLNGSLTGSTAGRGNSEAEKPCGDIELF